MLSAESSHILTAEEVAAELRCSKAHVYNMILGKVAGVSPLLAIRMGRRRLVRREALERWTRANERSGGTILPAIDTVGRMEEFHA
jgi:excisionase family DNA binding protein